MKRCRPHVLIVALLVSVLAVLPAQAGTTAERLQRLLWEHGDTTPTGWTGGDGTYSVELPDARIAWLFSDTFLGPTNGDGSRPRWAPFVHNSMVVQDGTEFTTNLTNGPATTLVEPTPRQAGFYWVGDGVVENGKLLVFVNHFVAAPAPYAFQQIATAVAVFTLPDKPALPQLERVVPMPLAFVNGGGVAPVSYGSAILQEGGYTYVYGVEDIHLEKYLYLARVPVGSLLDQSAWRYWTGAEWSDVPALAVRLLDGVANELSVHRAGDRLVLVTQDHAIGRDIMVSTAAAPHGPWSDPIASFRTPEGPHRVTYNAKAHEQFSTSRKLVVTYNVNAVSGADLYSDVTSYRPRFVEIALL